MLVSFTTCDRGGQPWSPPLHAAQFSRRSLHTGQMMSSAAAFLEAHRGNLLLRFEGGVRGRIHGANTPVAAAAPPVARLREAREVRIWMPSRATTSLAISAIICCETVLICIYGFSKIAPSFHGIHDGPRSPRPRARLSVAASAELSCLRKQHAFATRRPRCPPPPPSLPETCSFRLSQCTAE